MALSSGRTGTFFRAGPTGHEIRLVLPVGNDIIYQGALCGMVPGTGTVVACADTANMIFVGMANETVDGTVGGQIVSVTVAGEILIPNNPGSLAAANVGTLVTCVDDNTVSTAAVTTNDVSVGRLIEVPASGGVWVSFVSAFWRY